MKGPGSTSALPRLRFPPLRAVWRRPVSSFSAPYPVILRRTLKIAGTIEQTAVGRRVDFVQGVDADPTDIPLRLAPGFTDYMTCVLFWLRVVVILDFEYDSIFA